MTKPTLDEIFAAAKWFAVAYGTDVGTSSRVANGVLEAAYGARAAVACMDGRKPEARQTSDAEWWLYEYQERLVNIRYAIAHGQSERAMAMIDALSADWQAACEVKTPKRAEAIDPGPL